MPQLRQAVLGLEHEVLGGRKPGVFCHDHGSAFLSLHIGLALTNLGIVSRPVPKGSPKARSEVEVAMRDDGIVHHRLEGTTSWNPEWLKSFNYNPTTDAFVRLSDLRGHFYRNTFDVFNHKQVKSLQQRTRHQFYAAGRESLGKDYDVAPPEELLEVFLSHYYTGLRCSQGGVWIEGIPYQFEGEDETYRTFLGERELVFTRSAYNLEVAYMVDGINLEYHPLRVRPDYYEAVAGLDLWQLQAMQRANTPSSSSVAEAALDALLTQRQIRRDTRQGSMLAEQQRSSDELRELSEYASSVDEVISISDPATWGGRTELQNGETIPVLGGVEGQFETTERADVLVVPDANDVTDLNDVAGQPGANPPSWSIGGKVRQRRSR